MESIQIKGELCYYFHNKIFIQQYRKGIDIAYLKTQRQWPFSEIMGEQSWLFVCKNIQMMEFCVGQVDLNGQWPKQRQIYQKKTLLERSSPVGQWCQKR